jgi:hypothetical protein
LQVLFSGNFVKSFKKLSPHKQDDVLHYITKISNGWRPNTGRKISKMVNGYRVAGYLLITSKDIIKEELYTQVIKIWDLIPREHLYTNLLAKELENIFGTYNDHFISCCTKQSFEPYDVLKLLE